MSNPLLQPPDKRLFGRPTAVNIVYSASARISNLIEMIMKPANGGEEKPLIDPPNNRNNKVDRLPVDYLLYREKASERQFDVWALPMAGNDRKPFPVSKTEYSERDANRLPGHEVDRLRVQ